MAMVSSKFQTPGAVLLGFLLISAMTSSTTALRSLASEAAAAPSSNDTSADPPTPPVANLIGDQANSTVTLTSPGNSTGSPPADGSTLTAIFNNPQCSSCNAVPATAIPNSGNCMVVCVGPCCTGTWQALMPGGSPVVGDCNNDCAKKAASLSTLPVSWAAAVASGLLFLMTVAV